MRRAQGCNKHVTVQIKGTVKGDLYNLPEGLVRQCADSKGYGESERRSKCLVSQCADSKGYGESEDKRVNPNTRHLFCFFPILNQSVYLSDSFQVCDRINNTSFPVLVSDFSNKTCK